MERLLAITSQPAQTPHEKWFQETYSESISSTIEAIRNPPNPFNPSITWNHFKQLHNNLQQRLQKRTGQLLNMEQISTGLFSLRHTSIAMPGLSNTDQVVTIDSIHGSIQILPTKTKPKKMIFIGSDGVRYSYLFKGLEDLHLDERIMQFLSIVNNMFVKTTRDCTRLYRARHYSVTPLGVRSGLIQWVNGATPVFSLYKRWQQRELAIAQTKQQQQSTAGAQATPAANNTVLRPSELFYNKLNPLLKEKGISAENRKDWPLAVLRIVLEELIAETPKDLLAKELWCSTTSTFDWWLVSQTYARSTAVMSMIGYIIGLGDRHLDNVLVDLTTGEVVHIDYNVCFEKGKTLRVPERVPFRMTQNFESPLGLTGVEGTFRLSCEHVMKTMRRGRETLLTLLEAFVYDPLVDWTIPTESATSYTGIFYDGINLANGEAERKSRKDMEHEITIDMFSIRVAEMKSAWFNNRDDMLTALQQLEMAVSKVMEGKSKQVKQLQQCDLIQQQIMYLTEAVEQKQLHPIYTLPTRYKQHVVLQKCRFDVLNAVESKLHSYELATASHKLAQDRVRGPELQQLVAAVTEPTVVNPMPDFPAVVDFLQGAGQGHLVREFEQSILDLQSVVLEHRALIHANLDILLTYSTIVSSFPRWLEETNSLSILQQFLEGLICDFTEDRLESIENNMGRMYELEKKKDSFLVCATESGIIKLISQMEESLQRLIKGKSPKMTSSLEDSARSKRSLVQRYVQDDNPSCSLSMIGVLINELSVRAARILYLELSVKDTSTELLCVKSDDSAPWFADLMYSELEIVCLIVDLLGLLPSKDEHIYGEVGLATDETLRSLAAALKSGHGMYAAIQELLYNLQAVILPEACTAAQTCEPSLATLLNSLDEILSEVEPGAMNSLETFQSSHQLLTSMESIHARFYALLQAPGSAVQSRGQMLLMGFMGLFQLLDTEISHVHAALQYCEMPVSWCKIGLINEAVQITTGQSQQQLWRTLSELQFLKKLKLMSSFFLQCRKMADNLMGTSHRDDFYNEESLMNPVRAFICDYIKSCVLGTLPLLIGSIVCHYMGKLHFDLDIELDNIQSGDSEISTLDLQQIKILSTSAFIVPRQQQQQLEAGVSMQQLVVQAVERCLQTNTFTYDDYDMATTVASEAVNSCVEVHIAKQTERAIELCRYKLQRLQLQLMRCQWLHEDILFSNNSQRTKAPKYCLMGDLKKSTSALLSHHNDNLMVLRGGHSQLEKTILQRMKWAAGANPALSQTLQAFEQMLCINSARLEKEVSVSNEVIQISRGVLHFEATRIETSETRAEEEAFRELLRSCRSYCMKQKESGVIVSDIEESLMQSEVGQDLKRLDESWIQSVIPHLESKLQQAEEVKESAVQYLQNTEDRVIQEVNGVCQVLTAHHKLMSDLRVILKAIAKEEKERETSEERRRAVRGNMREYLTRYKLFSESFSMMLKSALSDITHLESYTEIFRNVTGFKDEIVSIYNDLVAMAPPISDHKDPDESGVCQTAVADGATASKTESSDFDTTSGATAAANETVTAGTTSSTATTAVNAINTAAATDSDAAEITTVTIAVNAPAAASTDAAAAAANTAAVAATGAPTFTRDSPAHIGVIKTTPAHFRYALPSSAAAVKEKVTRDPRTGKAVQERNSYAVNVWRKVKSKLDGRECESSNKRYTVSEQVDMVISEARNMDNLAALYEGWTPWV